MVFALLVSGLVHETVMFQSLRKTDETNETEDTTIELDVVYAFQNPQWNTAVESTIQAFEKEHPNILIHSDVNYGDTVYEDILNKKIARDELGDIIQLKTPQTYASEQLLGEIDSNVAACVQTQYAIDDVVYGIGIVESTWGVLYNQNIFEKYHLSVPTDYDSFLSVCSVLQKNGVTPIGVAGSDLWHLEYWVNHFFRTDVLLENEDWLADCRAGDAAWTDEAPMQMMAHLCELFQNGYVNEDWLSTTDNELTYRMSQNEIAMIYTGPWTAAVLNNLKPDMKIGWFYVPDANGNVCAADNFDTYWSVTASCASDAKKQEAAMEFLKYFYSSEVYPDFCRTTYTFPVSAQDIHLDTGVFGKDVSDALKAAGQKSSVYIGNEDTPEGFEEYMLETVRDILSEEYSPEEGMKNIQIRWEELRGEGGAS